LVLSSPALSPMAQRSRACLLDRRPQRQRAVNALTTRASASAFHATGKEADARPRRASLPRVFARTLYRPQLRPRTPRCCRVGAVQPSVPACGGRGGSDRSTTVKRPQRDVERALGDPELGGELRGRRRLRMARADGVEHRLLALGQSVIRTQRSRACRPGRVGGQGYTCRHAHGVPARCCDSTLDTLHRQLGVQVGRAQAARRPSRTSERAAARPLAEPTECISSSAVDLVRSARTRSCGRLVLRVEQRARGSERLAGFQQRLDAGEDRSHPLPQRPGDCFAPVGEAAISAPG
jgi:hypothetical protein